ncbi:MAG: pentapeptide repeat-containing protein [Prochloraceae cyanobacterium]|nr:pentapeptide repeat-containing protein [Prochloraceae cyanobacterium]
MWIFNRSLFQSKSPHADEQKQPTSVKEEEIKELAEKLWKAEGSIKILKDSYYHRARQKLETDWREQARRTLFNIGNRAKRSLQSLYNYSSLRIIWEKICPPKDASGKRGASTFILWILGIHFATFGIASGRYENRKDTLETGITVVATQLGTNRKAANRLVNIQQTPIPIPPQIPTFQEIFNIKNIEDLEYFWSKSTSPYYSLFGDLKLNQEIIIEVKDLIVSEKENLKEVNLSKIDLSFADLREAKLSFANLSSANLKYADLREAKLSSADLSFANLIGAKLRSANLSFADLREAKLSFANLSSANLKYADLREAKLSFANLKYADLRSAKLIGANLSSADLREAKLRGANLRSANLRSANLSFADLREAELRGANLSSADLSSANLKYADLSSANLKYADLSSAKLIGAYLEKADFTSKEETGVGLTIVRSYSGRFFVSIVYENTSASEKGIKKRDMIVKINGKETKKINIDEANKLLFDKEGTEVTLTIQRNDQQKDYVLVSDRFTISVQGLTPEQIKKAKNWEKAKYDPEFRQLLESTEETESN